MVSSTSEVTASHAQIMSLSLFRVTGYPLHDEEGRGPTRVIGFFLHRETAEEAVRGRWDLVELVTVQVVALVDKQTGSTSFMLLGDKVNSELPDPKRLEKIKSDALAKLSDSEKRALGLK